MPASSPSGLSTPLSSSSTLVSCPTSPRLKYSQSAIREHVSKRPLICASNVIELIASRSASASTVYVYDLAEQAGFGVLTKSWSGADGDAVPVVSLQTRSGAGRSLVGRLSEGTSNDTIKGAVLTAYTTPAGLSLMAHSLSYLPAATATSRLVLQVPRVISFGEAFSLSPSLAPLACSFCFLPSDVAILLSATPQESIDLAALSYNLSSSHVIHLFDHLHSSRELGHPIALPLDSSSVGFSSVAEAIALAGYSLFDYIGDKQASTVVVLLNGPLALSAKALAGKVAGLGILVVRVLRPWDETVLRRMIPSKARQIHVLDDVPNLTTQGPLYNEVLGSLLDLGLQFKAHRITPAQTHDFLSDQTAFFRFLLDMAPGPAGPAISPEYPDMKKLLFFSIPQSPTSHLPQLIEETFFKHRGISARILTTHDVFSRKGGITADRILLSQKDNENSLPISVTLPLTANSRGESDFLGVLDHNLLKSHSIIQFAKTGSAVLVATSLSGADLASSLPSDTVSLIVQRRLHAYVIDTQAIAVKLVDAEGPARDAVQNLVLYHAFLRLYMGSAATESLVQKIARATFEEVLQGVQLVKIGAHAWAGLFRVDFSTSTMEPGEAPSALREYDFNAIAVETETGDTFVNGARLGSWHDAAKHLLFPDVFAPPLPSLTPEKYPQIPSLRPEVLDRTYLVTCTVNRRLTPMEYDRNVFHLEFDTSGTGLKYAIGEALGVHGWNDEQDVLDFCAWYGVDPDRLITIPSAAGEGRMHTRTVMQALQQQIDLFGRPPKSFYTDLAPHASKQVDKLALAFIGSLEGSATFKKLAEKDTVTFADVLRMYPSAKPGIETLCEMVGDIKPRHYSIASAQSVVGDRVDLLVVTVEWTTPSGSLKYGQCTRYLSGLRPGQKVTVSIKPSVMKLPPDDMQPIIMAGLGTGAAPFRAFLQHRAWLSAQSIPVGPTYYYFGSRHKSQEYLYGEEIEAYILDGTITRAGLAFSRDGPKKVYIQHKMRQDAEELVRMLHDNKGVFYLCGPTWPVPDVYEALVEALGMYKGLDPEKAGAFLEGLKEEERYVLEVY